MRLSESTVLAELVFSISAVFVVMWSSGAFEPLEASRQGESNDSPAIVLLASIDPSSNSKYEASWIGKPILGSKNFVRNPKFSDDWSVLVFTSENIRQSKQELQLQLISRDLAASELVIEDATVLLSTPTKFSDSLPLPGDDYGAQMDIARKHCSDFYAIVGDLEQSLASSLSQSTLDQVCHYLQSDQIGIGKRTTLQAETNDFVGAVVIGRVKIMQLLNAIHDRNANDFVAKCGALSEINRKILEQALFLDVSAINFSVAQSRLKDACKQGGPLFLNTTSASCLVFGCESEHIPPSLLATESELVEWIEGLSSDAVDISSTLYPLNSLLACCRLIKSGKLPNSPAAKELAKQSLDRLHSKENCGPNLPMAFAEIASLAGSNSREFQVTLILSSQKERSVGKIRLSSKELLNPFVLGWIETDETFKPNDAIWHKP